MYAITPIHERDIENALRPFVREEFQSIQFGKTSLLVCGEHGALPLLKLSVRQAEDLVRGRDIDGEPLIPSDRERIAAWRLSFNIPKSLSILYALLPENNAAEIHSAQSKSSLTAMRELAGCLLGVEAERGYLGVLLNRDAPTAWSPSPKRTPASETKLEQHLESGCCGFVVFNSVASMRQNPDLQTTAFLLNAVKLSNGQVRSLASAESVMKAKTLLAEAYKSALEFSMWGAIGSPQQKESIAEAGVRDVPASLEQRVFYEPKFDRGWPETPELNPADQKEMIARWRSQGETARWGAKQAKALLREMRANQLREDFSGTWSFRNWEAKKSLDELRSSTTELLSEAPAQKIEKVVANDKSMFHSH
jgi:hypothetical protein